LLTRSAGLPTRCRGRCGARLPLGWFSAVCGGAWAGGPPSSRRPQAGGSPRRSTPRPPALGGSPGEALEGCGGGFRYPGARSLRQPLQDLPRLARSALLEYIDGPPLAGHLPVAVLKALFQAPPDPQRGFAIQNLAHRSLRCLTQRLQGLRGVLPRREALAVEVGNQPRDLIVRGGRHRQTLAKQPYALPWRIEEVPAGGIGPLGLARQRLP